jgi:hypothetical protein
MLDGDHDMLETMCAQGSNSYDCYKRVSEVARDGWSKFARSVKKSKVSSPVVG